MALCPDCHGRKTYVPFNGPPEPCTRCGGTGQDQSQVAKGPTKNTPQPVSKTSGAPSGIQTKATSGPTGPMGGPGPAGPAAPSPSQTQLQPAGPMPAGAAMIIIRADLERYIESRIRILRLLYVSSWVDRELNHMEKMKGSNGTSVIVNVHAHLGRFLSGKEPVEGGNLSNSYVAFLLGLCTDHPSVGGGFIMPSNHPFYTGWTP